MTPFAASFLLQKFKFKEEIFMKLNCEFFYGYEADQFKFYRVPQILVTDKRFKNVSLVILTNIDLYDIINKKGYN